MKKFKDYIDLNKLKYILECGGDCFIIDFIRETIELIENKNDVDIIENFEEIKELVDYLGTMNCLQCDLQDSNKFGELFDKIDDLYTEIKGKMCSLLELDIFDYNLFDRFDNFYIF